MKKIISVVLSVVLIMSLAVPAFADNYGPIPRSSVPVIYIRGDSNELSYDNGTKSFAIEDMLSIFGDSEEGSFREATFNILYPFILKGIAFNDWDDYYDAVYKEISDVYEPVRLDENGDPNDDCGIPQWQKDSLAADMVKDRAGKDGKYSENSYWFYYDWRLDPIFLADQLHEYIEGIKKATGHDKVSISAKCLGSNVVMAYINKYSADSLKGVSIDVSTSMGADFISGMISGNFAIDGYSLSRFVNYLSGTHEKVVDIASFVTSTIDLLELSGALDALSKVAREQLYEKIEYGIVSALALSTFFTYPGYWAVVTTEDFDNALRYVFGEEGSAKRETYKGLIEKITYYNETIKKNIYPLMQKLDESANLCVVSKYGVPIVPVIKDTTILADEYVSVYNSSFGATTSSIYGTLSDKYIQAQTEKGLGKYISPDKQIDASTCLFPDYTWFFKGCPHGHFSSCETFLLMSVIDADRQLTVDDFDFTQFIVYDYPSRTAYPMTTENCNTAYWTADDELDHPKTKNDKLRSFLTMLFRWLKNAFTLFQSLLSKKK